MDSFPKKGSKRSTNKNEKRILLFEIQQIKKTKRTLCDREDDDGPSGKSFVSARSMQKADTKNSHINQQEKILQVDVTYSSSENSSDSSSIFSCKRRKPNKSKTDQKAKSTRDSSDCSAQKISRSIGTDTAKNILNFSDDSSDTLLISIFTSRKTNRNRICSNSETEDDITNKASNISKKIYARNEKKDNSSNEFLDDAEALAKKALLEANSDILPNVNIAEDSINDTDQNEKNEAEDNDFDIHSVSTITFPSFTQETNVDVRKDTLAKLDQNYNYKNDKKLRMSCKVFLTQLTKKVLKRHLCALQKSREYLEHKAFKSSVKLNKLEKRRKRSAKKDSDSSTDDDSSSKAQRIAHSFNVERKPIRVGTCPACSKVITFGNPAAICSQCQIMAHMSCTVYVPDNCGLDNCGDVPKAIDRPEKKFKCIKCDASYMNFRSLQRHISERHIKDERFKCELCLKTYIRKPDLVHHVKQKHHRQHPGITGLKNLGNSCYMNSIIQCLSNTTNLAKYFTDNSYANFNTSNDNVTQGQVVEKVAQVIKALWRGQYKSISPHDLKVAIGQYKLKFESYEQQDSHEFLTFLLDRMHYDLKTEAEMLIISTNAEKEWNKAMNSQRSIISDLFCGQLRSTITCSFCRKPSTTYETFNSLTMSLSQSNGCTLNDCMEKFVTRQKVSGWKCPKCQTPRDATKKFDFVKLAPVVVIHLNRFAESGGWLEKRDTAVDFPLTGFNLKPYLVVKNTKAIVTNNYNYRLYAISNHYGTMDGGHYTAYCKNATQNKWYKYDDQTVTEVSPSQVKSQNTSAYLLFYTSFPNTIM